MDADNLCSCASRRVSFTFKFLEFAHLHLSLKYMIFLCSSVAMNACSLYSFLNLFLQVNHLDVSVGARVFLLVTLQS